MARTFVQIHSISAITGPNGDVTGRVLLLAPFRAHVPMEGHGCGRLGSTYQNLGPARTLVGPLSATGDEPFAVRMTAEESRGLEAGGWLVVHVERPTDEEKDQAAKMLAQRSDAIAAEREALATEEKRQREASEQYLRTNELLEHRLRDGSAG